MENNRIFIHIGKCGGSSLSKKIAISDVKMHQVIHIHQPPVRKDLSYAIATRSPIARSLSAFNWRYHCVITTDRQSKRFPGERQILRHYGSLNALGEALYAEDGEPNSIAQGNFRSIHHLSENISFYLKDLLAHISPDQIEGVISQESLASDAAALWNLTIGSQTKEHKTRTPPERLHLSGLAKRNLVKFLMDDFDCMETLDKWGKLSPESSAALAKEKSWANL